MMTDLQLYIAIGVPIMAVLASLVVSLVQISGIREDMRQMREEMSRQNASVREEMSKRDTSIREEMHEMRSDMREIRADIKILTGKVYEMMR